MPKITTPVVISYLRFSRPEQLKGDSIRRQLTLGDEWAKRNGMVIADTYRDLGISAFRGKNAAEGSLSKLLSLVDEGRIPSGSVLLIEQLDRLSRNALLEALELFLSIIRRGIKIVTLMDGMEYDRESLNRGMQQLMYSLMQMSLAHEESAKKSERLSHAWHGKRLKMTERPLSKMLPAWLKVEGSKIVVDEPKAATVRKIVALALAGHGLGSITRKMNADEDGLARRSFFHRSYVAKILSNRALIGEFQPHKIKYVAGRKRREPIGEPAIGYYPPLIDSDTFYAIRTKMSSRRKTGGRQGHFVNLFLGRIFDAQDGASLTINDKGAGKRYVSSAALDGRKGASRYIAFPVDVMERAVLLQLHDLILPHLDKDKGQDDQREADAMEARIAEVEKKIEMTTEAMLAGDGMNSASVVALLSKLDAQKKKMGAALATLRGEIAAHASTNMDKTRERLAQLVDYYRRGKLDMTEDERIELRNTIAMTIDRIEAKFERKKRNIIADLNITLRDGTALTFYVIAQFVDRMKRNEKGHPIRGGASGKPMFNVAIGDPRWVVVPNLGGTKARVASPITGGRVDVPIKR